MMKNTFELCLKFITRLLPSVKLNSSGKYLPDTEAAAQNENNIAKVFKVEYFKNSSQICIQLGWV